MGEALLLLSTNDELQRQVAANGGFCESPLSAAEINSLPPRLGAEILSYDEYTDLHECFVYDMQKFAAKVVHPKDDARDMQWLLNNGYTLAHDGKGVSSTVLLAPQSPISANALVA